MKKLLALVNIIVFLIPQNVKAEPYYIKMALTQEEGILWVKDKDGEKRIPNSFETDEIKVWSYPYSVNHSLERCRIWIEPENLRLTAFIDVKPEYHNELGLYYYVENETNGAVLEGKVEKNNELCLPLYQGYNRFNVEFIWYKVDKWGRIVYVDGEPYYYMKFWIDGIVEITIK
jgi:hypothetical protein